MMIHKLYEQNNPLPYTRPFHNNLIPVGAPPAYRRAYHQIRA